MPQPVLRKDENTGVLPDLAVDGSRNILEQDFIQKVSRAVDEYHFLFPQSVQLIERNHSLQKDIEAGQIFPVVEHVLPLLIPLHISE